MSQSNNGLSTKRPQWAKNKVVFHQDIANVITFVMAETKFNELGYEIPPRSPYLSD